MISQISGKIATKNMPCVVIDVAGVGYELECSMASFFALPEEGQSITLLCHLIVREDAHLLYGFVQAFERQLFRALIKVSGVGPKLALAVLSSMEPNAFVHCIKEGDVTALTRLPGVGKKTAERLILDLRDRLASWHSDETGTKSPKHTRSSLSVGREPSQEAISALVSLGYKPAVATRMVHQVTSNSGEGLSVEELIKFALQGVAST